MASELRQYLLVSYNKFIQDYVNGQNIIIVFICHYVVHEVEILNYLFGIPVVVSWQVGLLYAATS